MTRGNRIQSLYVVPLLVWLLCARCASAASLSCGGAEDRSPEAIKVDEKSVAYPLCAPKRSLVAVVLDAVRPDDPNSSLGSRDEAVALIATLLHQTVGPLEATAAISSHSAGRSSSFAYYEHGVLVFEQRHDETARRLVSATFWPYRQIQSTVKKCRNVLTSPTDRGIVTLSTVDGTYVSHTDSDTCQLGNDLTFFGAGPFDRTFATPQVE